MLFIANTRFAEIGKKEARHISRLAKKIIVQKKKFHGAKAQKLK